MSSVFCAMVDGKRNLDILQVSQLVLKCSQLPVVMKSSLCVFWLITRTVPSSNALKGHVGICGDHCFRVDYCLEARLETAVSVNTAEYWQTCAKAAKKRAPQ